MNFDTLFFVCKHPNSPLAFKWTVASSSSPAEFLDHCTLLEGHSQTSHNQEGVSNKRPEERHSDVSVKPEDGEKPTLIPCVFQKKKRALEKTCRKKKRLRTKGNWLDKKGQVSLF